MNTRWPDSTSVRRPPRTPASRYINVTCRSEVPDEIIAADCFRSAISFGPQDGAWLAGAVEQAESLLADVRFDRAE
jgi:hypothetical protein